MDDVGKLMQDRISSYEESKNNESDEKRYILGFLCRILPHKYRVHLLDKTTWEYRCKRCGKIRDIYEEGENKIGDVKYFKREDGKKNEK